MDIAIGIFICIQFVVLWFFLFAGRKTVDELADSNNQLIDEVVEEMCDRYCKYPNNHKIGESALSMICDNCPLNELNKIRR